MTILLRSFCKGFQSCLLLNTHSKIMNPQNYPKLTKLEKKILEKERKRNKKQDKKRDSQPNHHEVLTLSEYYFESGLRKVRPYYFTYETYTKRRWIGGKLSEVLSNEFHDLYKNLDFQIDEGRILVNGERTEANYRLKDGDFITNVIHRHEMPVLNDPIEIVHEDDNIVVVNKPSSIPVHPCGKYNLNSLLVLLAHVHNMPGLRVIHRLDRMTSGVTILGKNYDSAVKFSSDISSRQVNKEYVCLVEGIFPTDPVECRAPVGELHSQFGINTAATVELNITGKESWTSFRRMQIIDGNRSLVHCSPHTGRTHQIRVHLQYLGYPIVNDPIYNTPAWGPEKGAGGRFHKSLKQLVEDIQNSHQINQFIIEEIPYKKNLPESPKIPCKVPRLSTTESSQEEEVRVLETPSASSEEFDSNCVDCQIVYREPTRSELTLYLHALCYKGPNWEYSTDLPSWAKFETEGPCDVTDVK